MLVAALRGSGRVAPARQMLISVIPVDHLELDLDADLAEVLLDELVHRQRLHLARSPTARSGLDHQRLGRAVARLGQQLLGRGRIVLHLEGRLAEPLDGRAA